ncbi:DinB family protein [Brevibacillus daliensis]|uniref:DinB family protein n=1 Tax=Brevibacillus daliensis TaxID=2892995 RepID=UPI001E2A180A|nr:DinB family protein [Brevibacillus daliensis]
MQPLFQYNWQVRDEWFELLQRVPQEELIKPRVGGVESIMYTLFHIIDVEYSWIRGIQGKPDISVQYEDYLSIPLLKELSDSWRTELQEFLQTWSNEDEKVIVTVSWDEETYRKGEILRHVIAHEIHHMGQLSVWAKELGVTPASANLIRRGLYE